MAKRMVARRRPFAFQSYDDNEQCTFFYVYHVVAVFANNNKKNGQQWMSKWIPFFSL